MGVALRRSAVLESSLDEEHHVPNEQAWPYGAPLCGSQARMKKSSVDINERGHAALRGAGSVPHELMSGQRFSNVCGLRRGRQRLRK